MVKLSDRRRYILKYVFIFMTFISFIGLVMGGIFVVSNILEGPEALNYLHHATCKIREINTINNWCPVESEDFGVFYELDWQPCILKEFNITHDAPVDVNCTWVHPESFADEKQAIIQIRREFKIDEEYNCVVDEINNYCYPNQNVLGLEISVITIPGLMFIMFGFCTYHLFYKRKPLELEEEIKETLDNMHPYQVENGKGKKKASGITRSNSETISSDESELVDAKTEDNYVEISL